MTLDDFIKQERGRIEAFRMAWLKAHHTHPNLFPLEMQEGDEGTWDEALNNFDGENFDTSDLDAEEAALAAEKEGTVR